VIIYLICLAVLTIFYNVLTWKMRREYRASIRKHLLQEKVLFMILGQLGRNGAMRCRECYVELNPFDGLWVVPVGERSCDFYCTQHKPDVTTEMVIDG
jgi:hypothetical protein